MFMNEAFGGGKIAGNSTDYRKILHCDVNNFYASVEILHHPKLAGKPVAVGGSAEERHGIILAKNYIAKPFGIQVGMALWQARQRCPDLIILPPDYPKYQKFSALFRKILLEYTDLVEPFGLDESWCDVTAICGKPDAARLLADEIRERVKNELGLTISIGVSYNKIFAKLGSDIKKPDATTVISPTNFKRVVWGLPASDLLGVGRQVEKALTGVGILTIGDIANTDISYMERLFGKWGAYLHCYANGLDNSPVKPGDFTPVIKSVGNSTTCPRDLVSDADAHIVLYNLAESVAERMREIGMSAKTVQISLRTNDLHWFERQTSLSRPTMIAAELAEEGMKLLRKNYDWRLPLRSIGIRGAKLVPYSPSEQLSFFADETKRNRAERLEYAVDDIRRRFGYEKLGRLVLKSDGILGQLDAKTANVIHPLGFS
ncbi:MAG: DNA polymerase IV [Ruminococcus sp.]|jgi:DNA polymerase-4|nr:DNA polymerase IV [Ruminococcus sp.]